MSQLFIRSLSINWHEVDPDSYLHRIPSLRSLDYLPFHRNITLFAGENGTGKSTLLEALAVACGFNAEGGTKNYHFSTYNDLSPLSQAMHLTRGVRMPGAGYFFRAESFFNVATAIVREYDDGTMPDYHSVSHGESFLEFMSSSRRQGLYLMDEPEAALSPQRQLTLFLYIVQMSAAGSQFVIATHSPILLGIPDAEILEFSPAGIEPCAYEDTESYQVTRLFLEDRERLLRHLLEED